LLIIIKEQTTEAHTLMQEEPTTINVNEIRSKFSDKNTICLFLNIEQDAYLPPPKALTIFYLRALIDGSKSITTNTEVKPIKIPHYEQLRVSALFSNIIQTADFLKIVENTAGLDKYFPERRDCKCLVYLILVIGPLLPRDWISAVINTHCTDDFKKYVVDKVMTRK
jgi:hypothetical protein